MRSRKHTNSETRTTRRSSGKEDVGNVAVVSALQHMKVGRPPYLMFLENPRNRTTLKPVAIYNLSGRSNQQRVFLPPIHPQTVLDLCIFLRGDGAYFETFNLVFRGEDVLKAMERFPEVVRDAIRSSEPIFKHGGYTAHGLALYALAADLGCRNDRDWFLQYPEGA